MAPASAAVLWAAVRSLGALLEARAGTRWFLGGLAAYPVFHVATTGLGAGGARRFVYVAGHELTHAIAAWMSGYRVRRMRVSADGGHVDLSRSNTFVALAPYVLPLYALLVVAGYRVWLWRAAGHSPFAHQIFLALLGAALSFHFVFTASALWTVEQPDLAMAGGVVFSLALIALGNGVVLLAALKCLFPRRVSLSAAGRAAWGATAAFWGGAWRLAGVVRDVKK